MRESNFGTDMIWVAAWKLRSVDTEEVTRYICINTLIEKDINRERLIEINGWMTNERKNLNK